MIYCVALVVSLAQTPTLEQSVSFQSVAAPRLSPDGSRVVYAVIEADWKENEFRSQIWMARTSGSEPAIQLTASKKSSSAPDWSPDGKQVAFLSDRDGKQQLYLIAPNGGESTQLTSVETSVTSYQWSPDGKQIAFLSADPESKEKKQRKEKYGDFEIVQRDYAMVHLWTIAPTPGSKPERVTEGNSYSVSGFRWSPDSTRIAFSATKDPDLSSGGTADLYLIRIGSKTIETLAATKGPDTNPVWSPDGKSIAYESANGSEFYFYTTPRIAVIGASGGDPELLPSNAEELPRLLEWTSEGLWYESPAKTFQHLHLINMKTRRGVRISQPTHTFMGRPSFSKDFQSAAFLCGGNNRVSEVCFSSLKTFDARTITNMSEQWKPFRSATRELTQWKSKDGATIEGVLIKPADFDPAKKYPLLVVIHGGPRGTDRADLAADRYYPIERFAAKGAVILRPNYRGSEGYGEAFRALNVRNLGVGDYDDVITGVDALIAKGFVDRGRVGAMGWSQGGYISAFITCFSDRFKAVSVGAGISDWMTYYVSTDIHPFTRQYLKATPWEDPEIYRKTSPITYVNNAKTPTLIQHGELDKRVPIPNAYELYQALQDRNVPVKLSVFKGFGHGINKPKQQLAVLEQNFDWFSQWIWGEKPSITF